MMFIYIFLTYIFKRDFDALNLMLFTSYINGDRIQVPSSNPVRDKNVSYLVVKAELKY